MELSSWMLLGLGIALGISIPIWLTFRLGRDWSREMNLEDRGEWDRPLPEPIPKDTLVAVYKRRKWYHRHHRDYYRQRSK